MSLATAETERKSLEECPHVNEHTDLAECGASPDKTIDFFGSLCLVANNISGPAMMGIPAVMCQAGIAPTVGVILLVWVLSSLSGTMLSETIQKLPGNKSFDRYVICTVPVLVLAFVLALVLVMILLCRSYYTATPLT
jgi:amino acid permease